MKIEGDYIVFDADEARHIVKKPVNGDQRRMPGEDDWSDVRMFITSYNPAPGWAGRRPLHLCSGEMKRLAGHVAESVHFI
jgi:hypothetical protein